MNVRSTLIACALAPLVALSACNSSSSDGANVRLVNASTDFSTLDLYAGTSSVQSGVASYEASGYANLNPGTYTFDLDQGGTSVVGATTSGSVVKGVDYTFVAYTTGGALATQMLTESEPSPSSGYAKLRIFHTADTDAGDVDVYLTSSACSGLSSSAISAFATDVTGLQTSYSSVIASSSGTSYHVCVVGTGDKSDLRLEIPTLTLKNQEIATLILVRTSGGVLLNGLLLDQAGSLTQEINTSARIRLAVGASSNAAVTASANGVTLGSALAAPAVSAYQLVTAGTLTLSVNVGGNTAASPSASLSATAGGDYTLLVTGTAASAPTLIADDNSLSTSTASPVKLRLVNGMTGTNSTATLTDNYSNVGSGAVYGAASSYALEASSAALARLEADYGSTQLCLSTDVTLSASSVYSVFLLGDTPASVASCTLVKDR